MQVLTTPVLVLLLVFVCRVRSQDGCKCGPEDSCWPSTETWKSLNDTVSGKLIETSPVAISCYKGPQYNAEACELVHEQYSNATYQAENPVGYSYPSANSCPPSIQPGGEDTGTCSIGTSPRYAVNATEPDELVAGIDFAAKHNIRLVIRNTGHDILGRSTGYGSLEIWMRYLRKGITFEKRYKRSTDCKETSWRGGAFKIGGGYTWEDVYKEAESRGVVVVGGGTPTVGALGGWMQGGGHGPAAHEYGLGADQVLEAEVVLANGDIVRANACENTDLFFAIRGGGPGTYGVVTSTTVKAHRSKRVVSQIVSITSADNDMSKLMEAIAIMYSAYPDLSDAGFSGYGSWSIAPILPTGTSGFVHDIAVFGKSERRAKSAFAPWAEKLKAYNGTSLSVFITYNTYDGYWPYYRKESGADTKVGQSSALGSRLLDRLALTGDEAKLKEMLNVTAGTLEQSTSNNIIFVGGGQIAKDANDPHSGVNPAWRKNIVHNIVARGWLEGTDEANVAAIRQDVVFTKTAAMKQLAPASGCYMNEANNLDPEFLKDFYGDKLPALAEAKRKYDPESIFYCPTCVGSDAWREEASGKLCPALGRR